MPAMEIVPQPVQGLQVIQGYGDGGFRVAGLRQSGSLLVFPRRTVTWAVTEFERLTIADFSPVLAAKAEVDLLLVGTGATSQLASRELRAALRAEGIGLEAMSTSAACRTFNVLLAEERKVAAALIAVV